MYILPAIKFIASGDDIALHGSGQEDGEHGRHKEVFYFGKHSEWITRDLQSDTEAAVL